MFSPLTISFHLTVSWQAFLQNKTENCTKNRIIWHLQPSTYHQKQSTQKKKQTKRKVTQEEIVVFGIKLECLKINGISSDPHHIARIKVAGSCWVLSAHTRLAHTEQSWEWKETEMHNSMKFVLNEAVFDSAFCNMMKATIRKCRSLKMGEHLQSIFNENFHMNYEQEMRILYCVEKRLLNRNE